MAKVITHCSTFRFPTYQERELFARDTFSSQYNFIAFRYDHNNPDEPYVIEYFDINNGETYGENDSECELTWGNAIQNLDKNLSLPLDTNYDLTDDMSLGAMMLFGHDY